MLAWGCVPYGFLRGFLLPCALCSGGRSGLHSGSTGKAGDLAARQRWAQCVDMVRGEGLAMVVV